MTDLPDGAWVLRDLAVHPTTDRIRLRIGEQSIDIGTTEAVELADQLAYLAQALDDEAELRSIEEGQ